jgi:hypothetical protein
MTSHSQTDFDCDKLKKSIIDTRMVIDTLRLSEKYFSDSTYSNKVDTLNSNLIKYLRILAIDDRYQTCNVNLNYNFYSLISLDKRFCITSWDTRQGGTMIDFMNVVICKTSTKTIVKHLLYGENDFKDNSKIMFDTLFTIYNKKGQPIYLAYGSGQGSSALPFRIVKAFMISDSLIENFNIFPQDIDPLIFNDPNNLGEFVIEYDYHNFKGKDTVHEMKFVNGTLEIKVPIIKDNGRPSNKYYSLIFDGEKYIKK